MSLITVWLLVVAGASSMPDVKFPTLEACNKVAAQIAKNYGASTGGPYIRGICVEATIINE